MSLSRFFLLLFCLASFNVYATQQPYVIAISSGFSEDNRQTYGISSYETLGKGQWGLYGEMLLSYQGDTFEHCDEQCEYIDIKDTQLNFTVGSSYGVSDNLYALVGLGLRKRSITSAPSYNSDVCDNKDDADEVVQPHVVVPLNGEQYCSNKRELALAAQIGLLYITPIGLSFAGTIDTQKTATLSIGYLF